MLRWRRVLALTSQESSESLVTVQRLALNSDPASPTDLCDRYPLELRNDGLGLARARARFSVRRVDVVSFSIALVWARRPVCS